MTKRDVVVAETLVEPAAGIILRYSTWSTRIMREGKTVWDWDHIHAGMQLTICDDSLRHEKVVEWLVAALSGHEIRYREFRVVEIKNADGLHMRPGMQLVDLCSSFASEITIESDGICVDGKSIMQVSMLAFTCGRRLALNAYGPDARELVDALEELIEVRLFGEPPPYPYQ